MPMTSIIFIFRWSWVWVHFLELLLFSIPFSISLTTFFKYDRDPRFTFPPPLLHHPNILDWDCCCFFHSLHIEIDVFIAFANDSITWLRRHCAFFDQLVTFLFIRPKQWFHKVRVIGWIICSGKKILWPLETLVYSVYTIERITFFPFYYIRPSTNSRDCNGVHVTVWYYSSIEAISNDERNHSIDV